MFASFFFLHDGARILYKKENLRLVLQRSSAIVIVVLLHVHTKAYAHMATGEALSKNQALLYCVSEIVYITAVMMHTALSFSKAFITLGWIKSSVAAKRIDWIAYIVCGSAGIVAAVAVYLFF